MNDNNHIIEKESLDPISESFQGVITSLATFKSQITSLQQQLRCLEKNINRELSASRKEDEKRKMRKAKRKASGFAKPGNISSELSSFMSKNEGELVARTEVTKYIIGYIKENGLQNPENRKIILPNEELKKLLSVNKDEEVTYFNLQKHMNHHFV